MIHSKLFKYAIVDCTQQDKIKIFNIQARIFVINI